MASDVGICNRALQILGASSIVSLTEDSRDARAVNLAYQPCLEAELRNRVWNFATKIASLAASATPPIWGRANYFPLPADFLRLLPTYPEYNYNDSDLVIEGRQIATNQTSPLNIRYTSTITDPNIMDPSFREALSARIAIATCEQITQSNAKLAACKEVYRTAIEDARLANALENVPTQPATDVYLTCRM